MGLHMQMNEPQEQRAFCGTPNVLEHKTLTLVCKTACGPLESPKAHLLITVKGNHPLNNFRTSCHRVCLVRHHGISPFEKQFYKLPWHSSSSQETTFRIKFSIP